MRCIIYRTSGQEPPHPRAYQEEIEMTEVLHVRHSFVSVPEIQENFTTGFNHTVRTFYAEGYDHEMERGQHTEDGRVNHKGVLYPTSCQDYILSRKAKRKHWCIDINSLEELKELAAEKEIVLTYLVNTLYEGLVLEIYDDYRE